MTQTQRGSIYLDRHGANIAFRGRDGADVIGLRMVGARPDNAIARQRLPGVVNDLRGENPEAWKTGIPTFAAVRYPNLYAGIALNWYGNQNQLEYDFRLAAGANPREIAIRIVGADDVRIGGNGDLVIGSGVEAIRQRAPIAYQPPDFAGGPSRRVPVSFALDENVLRFKLGAYDRSRPLVIDPLILAYSTYFGGDFDDHGDAVAVGSTGSAFITGWTTSDDLDRVNPIDDGNSFGSRDAFVTKLNPDGSALVYSTYLGSESGEDFGNGIAVDAAGSAYVTGATNSTDFPTVNPIQGTLIGGRDAFVTKLSPGGDSLVYSTYLGGSYPGDSDGEAATDVAVDSAGSAYISGNTASTDFPTVGGIEGDSPGWDAFVSKLTPSGGALAYSTYLGGDGFDSAASVAVSTQGSAFITGTTSSTDFNTVSQIEGDSGGSDVFVSKLTSSGDALGFSTYLGGNSDDSGAAIALDSVGNAVVTGNTSSSDFDIYAPLQGDRGGDDVFVTQISSSGSLGQSTYLGGSGGDYAGGIAAEANGSDVWVAGDTRSSDFPSVNAIDSYSGPGEAFVTKIATFGTGLASFSYSTFLGGSSADSAWDIAVDGSGAAYVVGRTYSPDFPTSQPYEGPSTPFDAFITRLAVDADNVLSRRFQPVLRLDEGERWRPLDVDRMLTDEVDYVCLRRSCTRLTSFSQLANYTSSSSFIDIGAAGDPGAPPRYSDPDHYWSPACPPNGGQVMDCEGGSRSAIYYDTAKVSPSGYRYIQYWIFYRLNDSPVDTDPTTGDDLDHEADWEQMALAVPSTTALSAPTFDFANFGQHGGNFTYLRENLTCGGGSGSSCGSTSKHVHGFVSGGTHATYGESCTFFCTHSNDPTPETDHGGEVSWANNFDGSALRRLPAPYAGQWSKGPHAWVDWPGWWGLDASLTADHVASPANQAFYDFPWQATCVDEDNCTPQFSAASAQQANLSRVGASDTCAQWFGSGIAAVSCDGTILKRTLEAAEVGARSGKIELVLRRRRGRRVDAATTSGLAQLAARPLHPGDRLVISGPKNQRGMLLVRTQTKRRITFASFTEKQLSGRHRLVIERQGLNAIPMLREPGRPSLAPNSLAADQVTGARRG